MWTEGKSKLTAFGATVAPGMLMPMNSAFAAESPPSTGGDAGQTSSTTTDTTSRSYAAISNIMKTKHDTVKNSISNVR
jgi:hypothetical protein